MKKEYFLAKEIRTVTGEKLKIFTLTLLICTPYIYCMYIHPFTHGGWENAQEVWFDWQSLNSGMVTLLGGLIALWASHSYQEKQHNIAAEHRQREFIAAKSFLPEALSELTEYLEKCAEILYEPIMRHQHFGPIRIPGPRRDPPTQPVRYRDAFSRCISLSDSDLSKHLSNILILLQISDARIKAQACRDGTTNIDLTLDNTARLVELQALVSYAFDHARGEEEFQIKPLEFKHYHNAYSQLGFHTAGGSWLEEKIRDIIETSKR
ncbi:MAG: hypothetical protein REI09_11120 [Candidatus Dactylopiibacterium sp.]|nr:hypothetical protein [Candidatus Dactylopiibacterium sp.]